MKDDKTISAKINLLIFEAGLGVLFFVAACRAAGFSLIYREIQNYQIDRAKDLLKTSRLPESEKKFLDGIILFYEGKYPAALERISVSSFKTDFDWRGYLRKMTEISRGFSEKKIAGFIVRFYPHDRIMIPWLKDVLPKINSRMEKIFGVKPSSVVLEIYPDKEKFLAASLLTEEELDRSGTVAISKFNRLMILSPRILPYGYNWRDTVAHEYIHYIIGHKTALNIPLYLNEGIARTCESLWRNSRVELSEVSKSLLAKGREKGFVPFEKFRRGMPSLENQKEVSLAFAEVNFLVWKLIEWKGLKTLGKFLSACGRDGFEKSFSEFYSPPKKFLEDYWEELMNNKFEYVGAAPDFVYWRKSDSFLSLSARDFVRLGDRLRMMAQPDLALSNYDKALEKEKNNPAVLVKKAKILESMGKTAQAEKCLRKAVSLSDDFVSLVTFARFLRSEGRFRESIPFLRRAILKNPFFAEGYEMIIDSAKKISRERLAEKYEKLRLFL
ncbi:MAG: hypothetical protein J7L54_05715 [Elusimicrobia bacterium]|nr:hypothetical protein [Elusimicrobiota bacterium]